MAENLPPEMAGPEGPEGPSPTERIKRIVIGPPRDLSDRNIFQHISVVAFLAWVGLGADGLSSSSYGPEEAFRTLGSHTYLAIPIALLTMATVGILSACYSKIIERFPHGGGGYVVATALLGPRAGVLSGCALLVDYVLTITVSIAAAGDALFSFLPGDWIHMKLPVEVGLIIALTAINMRGVKEPILLLLPIFLTFLVTHIVLIAAGLATHAGAMGQVVGQVHQQYQSGLSTLGLGGMLLLFVHAYSMGGGTYTGIEAVSNGLPIMREPRVRTAKHTMLYMAISLSFTAAGLIVCYLLWNVHPVEGKTLNAVLVEQVTARWPFASQLVILTLLTEGALLVVGAQAGFIDGPRVMANMAIDSWMPRRLFALSDRLTIGNGIGLMGLAGLGALLYTHGDVRHLVVMYSINVFLTFSLSMLSMSRLLLSQRKTNAFWWRQFILFMVGLVFCVTILCITIVEKFGGGGWVSLLCTGLVVLGCLWVKRHYALLQNLLVKLYPTPPLPALPRDFVRPMIDHAAPTAVVLAGGYNGLTVHTLLNGFRAFPNQFKNVIFLGAGIIDSGAFKGEDSMDDLRHQTQESLKKCVQFAEANGIPATYRMSIGTDPVHELEKLCLEVTHEFSRLTFLAGQLVFRREKWHHWLLHNRTVFLLQRRLHLSGYILVILPARL